MKSDLFDLFLLYPEPPYSGDRLKLFGVVGCDAGWVVASSQSDLSRLTFHIVPTIDGVCAETPAGEGLVLIDIPIGLVESGVRFCDVAVYELLGPWWPTSRVFPVPVRATLAGDSYEECCAINMRASREAISESAYRILGKIREVDAWITPERHRWVREVYPELSFCLLKGVPLVKPEYTRSKFLKAMLPPKNTEEGQRERLMILAQHGLAFDPAAERIALGPSKAAVDELIDAAAALATAHRISKGQATMTGGGVDGRGLRMEILA